MTPNIFIKKRSGIYGIRNVLNNKIYIGRTNCFYKRCHQHITSFTKVSLKNINPHLFNSMVKHGIEHFEMFPLEFCDIDIVEERELYWMEFFNSTDRRLGYNIRKDSDGGMIVSDETSVKISNNLKRQWASGVRSGHSEKMKEKWKDDDLRKMKQGDLLRKIKTKYLYDVIFPNGDIEKDCRYSRLKELRLSNVMSSFHRRCKDTLTFKNHIITRRFPNALV